ncbi:hypothetical protein BZA05DRAFT_406145 [Tricharina praecox]|uniref:uncharacterized protein n=1 Tax=Tricharina praecox TaxID=43433 RepID=UPI0022201E45|nr:uncharacterized protein BZA05DRAFT_406145 [Tricharina praecox]KAI5847014.1 hypothetical protein BZA05DRAFT_406145 [Tricharina praecox]
MCTAFHFLSFFFLISFLSSFFLFLSLIDVLHGQLVYLSGCKYQNGRSDAGYGYGKCELGIGNWEFRDGLCVTTSIYTCRCHLAVGTWGM